jgi:hypothetical protein
MKQIVSALSLEFSTRRVQSSNSLDTTVPRCHYHRGQEVLRIPRGCASWSDRIGRSGFGLPPSAPNKISQMFRGALHIPTGEIFFSPQSGRFERKLSRKISVGKAV